MAEKAVRGRAKGKLLEGAKLARRLEKQNLSPDEVAAEVKAKLEGLNDDVLTDVLRLVGGSIHVQIPPRRDVGC